MTNSNEAKTTSRPWSLNSNGWIMGADGVHSIHSVIDDACISKEDASLIVKAVNEYEFLKEEVERLKKEVSKYKVMYLELKPIINATK